MAHLISVPWAVQLNYELIFVDAPKEVEEVKGDSRGKSSSSNQDNTPTIQHLAA